MEKWLQLLVQKLSANIIFLERMAHFLIICHQTNSEKLFINLSNNSKNLQGLLCLAIRFHSRLLLDKQ